MLSSLTEAKLYIFCLSVCLCPSSSTSREEAQEEGRKKKGEGGYPWTLARKNKKKTLNM
jgi:hypothetical protein